MTNDNTDRAAEVEAVAKAIDLKIGSLFPGESRALVVKELSDAAIAALDAHRTPTPHTVDTVDELDEAAQRCTYNGHEVNTKAGCIVNRETNVASFFYRDFARVLTATPAPTVKPDRETVVRDFWEAFHEGAQADYPEGVGTPNDRELIEGALEAIVEDWPGKTEREVKTEALSDFAQGLPLDGLRQAVRVLRSAENHWPADSVSQVLDAFALLTPTGPENGGE